MQWVYSASISVDKITKFSVRPPELRHVIRLVGNYYRWFCINPKKIKRETIDQLLNEDYKQSIWMDGLENQVCLRVKAFPELLKELEEMEVLNDPTDPIF